MKVKTKRIKDGTVIEIHGSQFERFIAMDEINHIHYSFLAPFLVTIFFSTGDFFFISSSLTKNLL